VAPEEPGQEDVATLATEEAAPPSAAVDPLVERYGEPVRLRLDSTEEEETAAYARFDECVAGGGGVALAGDGGQGRTDGAAGVGPRDAGGGEGAAPEAAHEACMGVAPLPPWEYGVQNPDAVDFAQGIVDCLRAAGVQHVEVTQD